MSLTTCNSCQSFSSQDDLEKGVGIEASGWPIFRLTSLVPIVLFSTSLDSKTDLCLRSLKAIPQEAASLPAAASLPPAAPVQVGVDLLYADID